MRMLQIARHLVDNAVPHNDVKKWTGRYSEAKNYFLFLHLILVDTCKALFFQFFSFLQFSSLHFPSFSSLIPAMELLPLECLHPRVEEKLENCRRQMCKAFFERLVQIKRVPYTHAGCSLEVPNRKVQEPIKAAETSEALCLV